MIPKKAVQPPQHLPHVAVFESARSALSSYYEAMADDGSLRVLMPAYIGWSPNEGSGLFDPIEAGNYEFEFYSIGRGLDAIPESLEAIPESPIPTVVVLVHYFGRPDPHYQDLVQIARTRGWSLVDDCAHAPFSFHDGADLGRLSDAMVFSLHKMLPAPTGGLLVTSQPFGDGLSAPQALEVARPMLSYDFVKAVKHRRQLVDVYELGLPNVADVLSPLWQPGSTEDFVPQSFPILVHSGRTDRDAIYEQLHTRFGLTTLYHTMVRPLQNDERFADSVWLSEHILNLPVHSDVDVDSAAAALLAVAQILRR